MLKHLDAPRRDHNQLAYTVASEVNIPHTDHGGSEGFLPDELPTTTVRLQAVGQKLLAEGAKQEDRRAAVLLQIGRPGAGDHIVQPAGRQRLVLLEAVLLNIREYEARPQAVGDEKVEAATGTQLRQLEAGGPETAGRPALSETMRLKEKSCREGTVEVLLPNVEEFFG